MHKYWAEKPPQGPTSLGSGGFHSTIWRIRSAGVTSNLPIICSNGTPNWRFFQFSIFDFGHENLCLTWENSPDGVGQDLQKMIKSWGRVCLIQLLIIGFKGIDFVNDERNVVQGLGFDPTNVQVMKLMIYPWWHFGSDYEQSIGCKDQDSIFVLVSTLEFKLDRYFEQNFHVLAQKQADGLVNVTSHGTPTRHLEEYLSWANSTYHGLISVLTNVIFCLWSGFKCLCVEGLVQVSNESFSTFWRIETGTSQTINNLPSNLSRLKPVWSKNFEF